MPPWYLLIKVVDAQGNPQTMKDGIRVKYCCPAGEGIYVAGDDFRVKDESGKKGFVEFPLAKGVYNVEIYIANACDPTPITVTLSEQNPIWEVILQKQ
jgi:hypothetical protein